MRIAVDVHVGKRGIKRLQDAGHEVVAVAGDAERDEDWFGRARAAGARVVISADQDLSILAYDHDLRFVRIRRGLSGVANTDLAILKMQAWAARGWA